METVQQNGRFTLFSSKFLSIYSILYAKNIPVGLSSSPIKIFEANRSRGYDWTDKQRLQLNIYAREETKFTLQIFISRKIVVVRQ